MECGTPSTVGIEAQEGIRRLSAIRSGVLVRFCCLPWHVSILASDICAISLAVYAATSRAKSPCDRLSGVFVKVLFTGMKTLTQQFQTATRLLQSPPSPEPPRT